MGAFPTRAAEGRSDENTLTVPTVIREAPNYPITRPITGQFLELPAAATSPIPQATLELSRPRTNRSVSMSLHRAFEILSSARVRPASRQRPCADDRVKRQSQLAELLSRYQLSEPAIFSRLMAILLRGFSADR